MRDREEHLSELELNEDATPEQIRQAYRDLAKVWHPDRFQDDPRMRAKATEKLRRVIEAYDYLRANPRVKERPPQPHPAHGEPRRAQTTASADPDERDAAIQALAALKHQAKALFERVNELKRGRPPEWERRAWTLVGLGILLPPALVFIATGFARAAGSLLWLVFTGSCISVFVLTAYRSSRLREQTSDAVQAVKRADVRCIRCGRGVAGSVSAATAEQALGRAGWALKHLRCPHCRHSLI